MYTFLIVLGIIVAILLIVVVFVQSPKSDSAGSIAGGGGSQILGAAQTSDFLEKTTWTLIVILFVIALASGIFLNTNNHPKSLLEQKMREQGVEGNSPIKKLEEVIKSDSGKKDIK